MAKDPDDRPASAGALVTEMLGAWAGPRRPAWPRRPEGPRTCDATGSAGDSRRGEALNGRYEIVAPISSGAMGAVYRAIDRETGGEVASSACWTSSRRPLRDRGAAAGQPQPPARGQGARPLERRAGPLHRHGARPRRGPGRDPQAQRRPRAAARRRDRVRPPRLRGAPVRARPADRAPRRQAAEHDPGRRRRGARGLRRRPRARQRGGRRGRSRSARRATWRPRCSPAARCPRPATSSAWPRRCGRC